MGKMCEAALNLLHVLEPSEFPSEYQGVLPECPGVYLVMGIWGRWYEWEEIDVYDHPVKGLSVFTEDYGGEGNGLDDETGCHVSVQMTGLVFGKKVRELKGSGL